MKYAIIFIFVFWFYNTSFWAAGDKPNIIPRSEWWANDQYNSKESNYWQNILESWSQANTKTVDADIQKIRNEKIEKINSYLYENFEKYFTLDETLHYNFEWGHSYAWPLKYTNFVDSIVVHHTEGEYKNSLTWINNIHKFHSLSRQWGDIWYNYIIGYDWEIYEWREGGDYTSGAHSKYNNFWSVGIALLWNYDAREVSIAQKDSLESLIQYVAKKYGIDFSKKRYYHMNCSGSKCAKFPIETYLDHTLVWHRDTWHTSCPWANLYTIIEEIRDNNLDFTAGFTQIARNTNKNDKNREDSEYQTSQIFVYKKYLIWYERKSLYKLKKHIEIAINSWEYNESVTKKLQILRLSIVLSLKDQT